MSPDDTPPGTRGRRARLARARTAVRRQVLRRRRLLAALCAAVAVVAGLQAAAPAPPVRTPVLTAAHDLPAGRVVTADDLAEVAFEPEAVPGGLADDPVGRTLAAPLRRGEPLTDVRLVAPSMLEGHPGLAAVPVRLPDAAVAGLLRVGDEVDLVAADPRGEPARTVADGVRVLALPEPDPVGTGDATAPPGRLVVVGVAEHQVTAVADAMSRLFLTVAWSR